MKRTFNEVVREFLDYRDATEGSKETYRRVLRIFANWTAYAGANIKYLTKADILRFKFYLEKEGKAENTIDNYLSVIRLFYTHCENSGEHDNIAAGVRIRHKNRGYKKSHLKEEEANLLLSDLEERSDSLKGKRDYALINLMLRTGIRCIEAERLRVKDLRRNGGGYSIKIQRKGRLTREENLGLSVKAAAPILDYLEYRGVGSEDESIFKSVTRDEHNLKAKAIGEIITGHLKRLGLYSEKITAHSLRHTAAAILIKHGVAIKEVQLMLGHRLPQTTEIYIQSIEDEIRLENPATRALDDIFKTERN